MVNSYQEALEHNTVQQFVRDNQRSPSELELRLLLKNQERKLPSLAEVGFTGHLVTKPQFASVSSAEEENLNRRSILFDTALTNKRIQQFSNSLENNFRGFFATTRSIKRQLDLLEARVDNLLLISGTTDVFVYGIEENFTVQDKVDFSQTTASVEAGFITIGRDGFGLVDLSSASISYNTTSDNGYVAFQNTSSIETLKQDDGSIWEHLVYTNYRQGRVSLIIDVTLDEPQYISEFRFTGASNGLNGRTTATGFYSLDGKTYKALEPQEIALTTNEQIFNVGLDGVTKIRLMLAKNQYDNSTQINGQYVYLFSLDSLKLYSSNYASNAESVFVAGPYDVVDESGDVVSFTKATCEACVSQGEETAVALYLSVDGEDWKSVDHTGEGLAVATFANGSSSGTDEQLDLNLAKYALLERYDLVETDIASDALLNTAVAEEFAGSFIQKSVELKRNIYVDSPDQGWYYDPDKRTYKTTIVLTNPDGQALDLGSTGAYINGILMSGLIQLKQGTTTFETNSSNWIEVPTGLRELTRLRKADPLYPYNHKYLVEGYAYADTFVGERTYTGVEEYFGALLTYVPPELFESPENINNLGIYTIDDSIGKLVFKVKVDKQNGNWRDEAFAVDWLTARGTANQIYIKAILTSTVDYQSPVVTSLKVRVV